MNEQAEVNCAGSFVSVLIRHLSPQQRLCGLTEEFHHILLFSWEEWLQARVFQSRLAVLHWDVGFNFTSLFNKAPWGKAQVSRAVWLTHTENCISAHIYISLKLWDALKAPSKWFQILFCTQCRCWNQPVRALAFLPSLLKIYVL